MRQLVVRRLQMEMEKSEKDRELEWDRTRRGLSVPKSGGGGGEGGEQSVECIVVRGLQLIHEFDEQRS